MNEISPLVTLYGEDAIDRASKEIEILKANSNIPFDMEYVRTGISFSVIKADEILKGERKHSNLRSLISESFGEAAIYKYNVNE